MWFALMAGAGWLFLTQLVFAGMSIVGFIAWTPARCPICHRIGKLSDSTYVEGYDTRRATVRCKRDEFDVAEFATNAIHTIIDREKWMAGRRAENANAGETSGE